MDGREDWSLSFIFLCVGFFSSCFMAYLGVRFRV
jgi:hypothetical protein